MTARRPPWSAFDRWPKSVQERSWGYLMRSQFPSAGVELACGLQLRPLHTKPIPFSRKDFRMALNQQTLQGNWNQIKGKLHERWGGLTDDDLTHAQGNV